VQNLTRAARRPHPTIFSSAGMFMDRLDCDRMFVAVLEVGSFAGAAERLGTSSGQASKLVSRLEQELGVQLFKRSTRALSPTEIGRAYYERVKTLLEAFDTLDATVRDSATTPSGRLKISAPGTFGTAVLASVLVEFARHYPQIELDVNFSDRAVNIVHEGFDMAIRIGTLPDSSLIARRLGEFRRVICGSPSYLQGAGAPRTPEELSEHLCLRYGRESQTGWELFNGDQRKVISVHGPMVSNNGEMLRDAAVAGLGLIMLPEFIVAPALASGELVKVLEEWQPTSLHLNALYPQHRQRSEINRVFMTFLQQKLA